MCTTSAIVLPVTQVTVGSDHSSSSCGKNRCRITCTLTIYVYVSIRAIDVPSRVSNLDVRMLPYNMYQTVQT